MVSTRSSRLSVSATPAPATTPRLQTPGRRLRSQNAPGSRSSAASGLSRILRPERITEESRQEPPMSSPGTLAHRYGSPARRAAPMPLTVVSLSQLTAQSSSSDYPSQEVMSQMEVDDSYQEQEPSASPEPETSQAPRYAQAQPSRVSPVGGHDDEAAEDAHVEAAANREKLQSQNDMRAGSQGEPPAAGPTESELVELKTACLEDLGQATRKLVETLFHNTSHPTVRNKLININRQAFRNLWDVYADVEKPFIDVYATLTSLDPDAAHPAAPRIICQANLAKLLDLLAATDDPAALADLSLLLDDGQFPAPFSPFPDLEDVDLETVSHAMDVRVQAFIAMLASSADMSKPVTRGRLLKWVTGVFCGSDDGRSGDRADLAEADMADICGIPHPLPAGMAKLCFDRVMELLDKAQGSTLPAVIEALREAYPVHEWRNSLQDYAYAEFFAMDDSAPPSRVVSEELEARPGEPGQLEAPREELPEELPEEWLAERTDEDMFQPDDEPTVPSARESDQASAGPSTAAAQQIIRRPESTAALKLSKEMVSFLLTDAPSRQADAAPVAVQSPRGSGGNDDYNEQLASRARARLAMSQGRPPPSSRSPPAPPSTNGRKRGRAEEAEDDSDETDEFEQDVRQPDDRRRRELDRRDMAPPQPKRQKRSDPAQPQPHRRPRLIIPRDVDDDDDDGDDDDDPFAEPPRRESNNPPPASAHDPQPRPRSQPPPAPAAADTGADALVDFAAIRERNRLSNNRLAAGPEARPQQRIPWSNEDTLKLIDFIAECHCGWATIYEEANPVRRKKDPPGRPPPPFNPARHFSVPRTQQQIRDKARNLKVDFLKADLVLPTGFDGVILGPKERRVLENRGKNPERLEADIDARGNPTNTFFP